MARSPGPVTTPHEDDPLNRGEASVAQLAPDYADISGSQSEYLQPVLTPGRHNREVGIVHGAALPRTAQHADDRVLDPLVLISDRQAHAGHIALTRSLVMPSIPSCSTRRSILRVLSRSWHRLQHHRDDRLLRSQPRLQKARE
jgi:hypothetical protein